MKKRILSAIISLLLVFSVMPTGAITAFAESNLPADDFTWELNNGTLTIDGNGSMPDTYYLNRPWQSKIQYIKRVIVNEGITYIGSQAFYECTDLTTVTLPSTVTKIGKEAFRDCKKLETINLPDNLTSIGESAFCNCKLLTLNAFPSKLQSLDSNAFSGCENLELPAIPKSVTNLHTTVYFNTKTLNDFKKGEETALYNGDWLLYVKSDYTGVLDIKAGTKNIAESVFSYSDISEVIIPEGITELQERAFENCHNLESVTLPDTLKTIGSYCFFRCDKLETIALPEGITKIGLYTFNDTAYYENEDNWEDGILYNGEYLIVGSIDASRDLVVKPGTKLVADSAFQYARSLTSLTLPEGLEIIGDRAFAVRAVNRFTSLHIPESVKYIGYDAFYNNNIENVNIPKNLEYIGESAFHQNNLSCEITIPKTVTTIGEGAFSDNPNIKKITVDKDNQNFKLENGCLIDTKNKVLILGIGNADIPNDGSIEKIGEQAFYGNEKMTALNLPKSVKEIGNEAFYGCINLKTITVDAENTEYKSVNNCLISKDGTLELVCANSVLPQEGITKRIYGKIFYKLNGLKNIHIPSGVVIDYPGYLASCPDLETITVDPDHSTYTAQNNCLIKDNAIVAGCKGSTIPESENVTEIREDAFIECANLKKLHIPANITTIDCGAFYGCDSLETIAVSADNTKFYVKNNCLIRISDDVENPQDAIILGTNTSTIPTDKRVAFIEHYAFYQISIENLVIPVNIAEINYRAINYCKNLKTLTILSDDTEIYNGGYYPYFDGCDQVTVYCNEGSIAAKSLQESEYIQNFVVYCKNHKNLATVNGKKATPTADGYTGDTKCKDCGIVVKKSTAINKVSNITLSTSSYTYDGKAKKPTVTVKNSKGTKLTLNKDYTVSYAGGRTNVGTYKVTITLKGNYSGTVVKTFKINAKKVTPTVSNYPSKTYNGKSQTQKLTVKVGKTTLKSSQYTVKYSSNKWVGKASVKVTLKGNYSGSKTVYFNINPKGTSLKSVAGGKKQVTVKWNKQSTQTSGYQIQYSTSKSFKGAKTVTVSSNKTTSKTIKNLTGGKKYYVRVRTYKTVGKTKYYSSWSSSKYATAKKK